MKLIKPTKINEYQETKADRIIETVFIIGLTLILLILSVLILATTSHASNSSQPLPLTNYTAPRYLTDEEIAFFNEMVANKPSLFTNHYVDLTSDGIYCFNVQLDNKIVNTRQWSNVMGYVFYKPYSYSVGTFSYDSFDLFSSSTIELNFSGYEKWEFWQTASGFSSGYNGWYGGYGSSSASTTINIFGLGNDVTIQDPYHTNTFKTGYPIYWSTPLYNGTSGVPILNQPLLYYGKPGFVVQEGHAEEPDFDNNDNINSDGHAQQPNTPTFPTFIPPTIDTSTLETLVESLIDFVGEFADFVGECFSVFFSWLVEVIQNVGQSLYNAILEMANFLYNNFVSLFEPMMVNIGHAVEPVQEDDVISAFESTDFYGLISDFTSFTTTFDNAFDVSEPETFTITIHVENISLLNQNSPYILNLGSNFLPIRNALRTFLWILVSFASVIFIEHNLSSWLKGSGEEK